MPHLGRKVLVVGAGGREQALASRLLESESVAQVLLCPGNAGTDSLGRWTRKDVRNVEGSPLLVARRDRPDLVLIGPEAPLCAGLADELRAEGCRVFGPGAAAARLEGSKAFMKEFVARCGVRTARHQVVRDVAGLDAALGEFSTAPVVKADGLCAGKGVVVANTHEEARSAALEMLDGSRFGDAGRLLVLEERLRGFELSVHALCDGNRSVFLPVARDYKRIGDGDEGPNTGGMGTFAPNPAIDEALGTRIREEIMDPLVRGFSREGLDYRGTLFAGLMVEHGVPHLLEINVRFGDPETQVLMGVLDGDFGELLCAAADGRLSPSDAPLRPLHSVCVVLAAAGYPGDVRSGDEIHGIERAEQHAGVRVYHAGTRRDGELLRTAGGRVVGVTAVAGSLAEARKQAYAGAAEVRFAGKQMRGDIAAEPR